MSPSQSASKHAMQVMIGMVWLMNRFCGTEVVVITPYRALSNSLIYGYYCKMAGIEMECDYDDYLRWLPSLRPYKSSDELPWKEFVDECYLVMAAFYILV